MGYKIRNPKAVPKKVKPKKRIYKKKTQYKRNKCAADEKKDAIKNTYINLTTDYNKDDLKNIRFLDWNGNDFKPLRCSDLLPERRYAKSKKRTQKSKSKASCKRSKLFESDSDELMSSEMFKTTKSRSKNSRVSSKSVKKAKKSPRTNSKRKPKASTAKKSSHLRKFTKFLKDLFSSKNGEMEDN